MEKKSATVDFMDARCEVRTRRLNPVRLFAFLAAFFCLAGPARAGGWMGFTMGRASGGVLVRKVLRGSPAERAGLRAGDVVLQVDGKAVGSPRDMVRAVARRRPGDTVRLRVLRGGQGATMPVRLTLAKRPGLLKLLRLLMVGERAPDFALKATDGRTVRLSALRGRVVILEFWATWCGSCKISLRKLAKLQDRFPGKVLVVAPARNTLAEVRAEAAKLRLKLTFLADPGAKVAARYHFSKTPTIAVVDKKGIIRGIWIGSSYDERVLAGLVARLVRER